MDAAALGVVGATLLAAAVEMVEALTIVLAMGVARSWRSALCGAALALVTLAVLTLTLGVTLSAVLPESLFRLIVGSLMLVFGLDWLRKAVLRSAGLKALHDEDEIFRRKQDAAARAGSEQRLGLDWYAFVVSFKGVFLEGLEVVFIVITFGTNAGSIPLAAAGAGLALVLVLVAGAFLHRPLAAVPENTLKHVVAALLATFGTFWLVEGLGVFAPDGEGVRWPGGDAALAVLLVAWVAASQAAIAVLRRSRQAAAVERVAR